MALGSSVVKSGSLALLALMFWCGAPIGSAPAGEITITRVNTIDELNDRIGQCWQSPKLPEGHPGLQITVMFTLTRSGEIFGKPRITFESPEATEDERILYRTAVMETLQRCTPIPFTPAMGSAFAGHITLFRFDDRRNLPKQPVEKRA